MEHSPSVFNELFDERLALLEEKVKYIESHDFRCPKNIQCKICLRYGCNRCLFQRPYSEIMALKYGIYYYSCHGCGVISDTEETEIDFSFNCEVKSDIEEEYCEVISDIEEVD
jgi:hypothetical protein